MRLMIKNSDHGNKALEIKDSEMSKDNLVAKVCVLYNISPAECRLSRFDSDFEEFLVIEEDEDCKEIQHKAKLELIITQPPQAIACSTPKVLDNITIPIPPPGSAVTLPFKDVTDFVQNGNPHIVPSSDTESEQSLDASSLSVNER